MSLRRASPVPVLFGNGHISQVSTALRAVLDLVSRGPCISSNYSTMLSCQMYDSNDSHTLPTIFNHVIILFTSDTRLQNVNILPVLNVLNYFKFKFTLSA